MLLVGILQQLFSSKLQKLSPAGNSPPTLPLSCSNFRGTYQEMKVGMRVISKGFGKDDQGEGDDDSQLREREDKSDKKKFGENKGDVEN